MFLFTHRAFCRAKVFSVTRRCFYSLTRWGPSVVQWCSLISSGGISLSCGGVCGGISNVLAVRCEGAKLQVTSFQFVCDGSLAGMTWRMDIEFWNSLFLQFCEERGCEVSIGQVEIVKLIGEATSIFRSFANKFDAPKLVHLTTASNEKKKKKNYRTCINIFHIFIQPKFAHTSHICEYITYMPKFR